MLRRCKDCTILASDVCIRQCDYHLCDDCDQERKTNPPSPGTRIVRKPNWKKHMINLKANSKNTTKSTEEQRKGSTSKPSLKDVSSQITERHVTIVQNMTEGELKNFSELETMKTVQKDIEMLMSKDFDKTTIVNESFNIVSKIKKEADNRLRSLTRSAVTPGSVVRAIFANPLTPLRPPARTNAATNVSAKKIECSDVCKLDHVEGGETFNCSFCDKCMHQYCLDLKKKPPVFFCDECRQLPKTVKKQADVIDVIITSIHDLRKEIDALRNQRQDTASTTNIPAEPSRENEDNRETAPADERAIHTPVDEPARNLLIGHSMIRDINAKGLKHTDVKCIRGGNVQNIRQTLNEYTDDT